LAELKGSGTIGPSVAISGTTAVVGAYGGCRAYVYTRTSHGWKLVAKLKGSDTKCSSGAFGWSVAISGTTVVVGAPLQLKSRAYVFTRSSTGWKQVAELKGSGTATGESFGWSVAISGTTIVVGAPESARAGRAYVYKKTATGWKQVVELKGSNTVANDRFHSS
jgi:hypothetical protein